MDEKEIIRKHYQDMQKRGVIKRLANDPNTYKKMRAVRTEKKREGELEIITE